MGYVHRQVALVTAAFVAGTASRGATVSRVLRRGLKRGGMTHRWVFVWFQACILVYALLLPFPLMTINA